MKTLTLLLFPLSAAFMMGQSKITLNGVLVDAACQNTRTERTQTQQSNGQRTVTETTKTTTVDCPVTANTNAFGLITSDGKFVRFDNPSNSRVVEIVHGNEALVKPATQVTLVGTANGDVAVVESLTAGGAVSAERLAPASNVTFDARYKDDRGKLVVGDRTITFEDISNAKHSQTWIYSQIKEFRRDGKNEIKIVPYSGDDLELTLDGPAMSEAVYKTIADRITAARSR